MKKRLSDGSARPNGPAITEFEPVFLDCSVERIAVCPDRRQDPEPAHPEWCLHFHPHYELIYLTRGIRSFYVAGKSYHAEAGDLIIFRPGQAHVEFGGTPKVSYIVFRFFPQELSVAGIEFPSLKGDRPFINLPRKQEFFELFGKMVSEFRHPDADSNILLGVYLIEFVVRLRRAAAKTESFSGKNDGPAKKRVQLAMDLLQQDVTHGVDLQNLAHRTFMSVSHLSHTFKAQVGESPRRYQIRERIRQARKLLLETGKSGAEIAEQLGYTSSYFFYRQFRLKTGMTTSEFRRRFCPRRDSR